MPPAPHTIAKLTLERGIRATRAGRPADAVHAYGQLLASTTATPRQYAIAAFNRGLLREAVEDHIGAFDDWTSIISNPGAPRWMLCRAFIARAGLRRREYDEIGAVCDLTGVIVHAPKLETTQQSALDSKVIIHPHWSPLEMLARSQLSRGNARLFLGDHDGAFADITAILQMTGISPKTRGRAHAHLAEAFLAIADWDHALAAARECNRLEHRIEITRCLAAIALLAKGDWQSAYAEFLAGIQWVKALVTVKDLRRLLENAEKQTGPLTGMPAIQALLAKRQAELEKKESTNPATTLRRLSL